MRFLRRLGRVLPLLALAVCFHAVAGEAWKGGLFPAEAPRCDIKRPGPEVAAREAWERSDYRLYWEEGGGYFGLDPSEIGIRKAIPAEEAGLKKVLAESEMGKPLSSESLLFAADGFWVADGDGFWLIGVSRSNNRNACPGLAIATPLPVKRAGDMYVPERGGEGGVFGVGYIKAYNQALLRHLLDDGFLTDNRISLF